MKFSQLLSLAIYMVTNLYELAYCISCLHDDGKPQDWFILYKIPKIKKSNNILIQEGYGYTYLDLNGKWILSNKSIADPSNQLMRTISQIGKRKEDTSYFIYNDEDPRSGMSGAKYGHTKGILAVDAKRGYWIIHSIPNFPTDPQNAKIRYPKTGKVYGQTIMCITFDNRPTDLNKILKTFMYTVPNIYAHHAGEGIRQVDGVVRHLFSKEYSKTVLEPPYSYVTEIVSPAKSHFKIFGKHKKWDKDLYGDLVATTLKAPLRVETWCKGSGGIMPSSCNLTYPVSKVEEIKLNTSSAKIVFSSKHDHSKWATTESGYEPYVCIGDINRVKSQWKRGGGTVCLKNSLVWKAFEKTAFSIDQCKI